MIPPQPMDRPSARANVELALSFDRSSTRLVQRAEAQVASAQADLDMFPAEPSAGTPTMTTALQVALGARRFATEYQDKCRAVLSAALDQLGATAEDVPGSEVGWPSTGSSDAVVAEATAIAAGELSKALDHAATLAANRLAALVASTASITADETAATAAIVASAVSRAATAGALAAAVRA